MCGEATVFDSAVVALSLGDYAPIRQSYYWEVWGLISEYLAEDGARITRFRNGMKRSIAYHFGQAAAQGWADGGGGDWQRDADADSREWESNRIYEEFGYVDELFRQLRELKKEGEDAIAGEAERRAEGYARTLDGIYAEAKIRAAGNKMLTFDGFDGQESCNTCQRLKGSRHRASWWIRRGLVPHQGNRNFECGGWNCQHYLYDDQGNVWSL